MSNVTVKQTVTTELRGDKPVASRESVLAEAQRLIDGDRQDQYGSAADTHKRIAEMWNALLPYADISPSDVALMMACVKIVRAKKNPQYRDSWVDIAGYAAHGAEIAGAR